jgi:GxxExxY protein
MFEKLSDREEELGNIVIRSAFKVHKELGPGLLEKIYEACFCYELSKLNIPYRRQLDLPIKYDGKILDEGLKLDVLVDGLIICELKAKEEINPLWQAQLISHLKLSNLRLGYLINFNVPLIKNGIKRFVN